MTSKCSISHFFDCLCLHIHWRCFLSIFKQNLNCPVIFFLMLEIVCLNCEEEFSVVYPVVMNPSNIKTCITHTRRSGKKPIWNSCIPTFKKDLYPGLFAVCILTISKLLVHSYGRSAVLLASPIWAREPLCCYRLMISFSLFLFSNQRDRRPYRDSRESWPCSTNNSGESELPPEVFASSVKSSKWRWRAISRWC